MLADKILGGSCVGFLVAAMSAMNEELRHKMVALADGGLRAEASDLALSTMRYGSGVMDAFNRHSGDNGWLLITACIGAVVGGTWFIKS